MGRHADVVEQGFEAFNRHDFDVMAELCTPDVEWTPPEELPGQARDPDDQQRRQRWRIHLRLSFVCDCGLDNHSMRGEPSFWKGPEVPGTSYSLFHNADSYVERG